VTGYRPLWRVPEFLAQDYGPVVRERFDQIGRRLALIFNDSELYEPKNRLLGFGIVVKHLEGALVLPGLDSEELIAFIFIHSFQHRSAWLVGPEASWLFIVKVALPACVIALLLFFVYAVVFKTELLLHGFLDYRHVCPCLLRPNSSRHTDLLLYPAKLLRSITCLTCDR